MQYTRNLGHTTADNLTDTQIEALRWHAVRTNDHATASACIWAQAGIPEARAKVLARIQADEKAVHAKLDAIEPDPNRYGYPDE